jgi:hypothetical protein
VQAIVWPPQAARSTVSVVALPDHRAHASAGAVPGRVTAILERPFPAAQAAAQARLVLPAASARSAEVTAGVARHGAVAAEAAQHEAVPRPEERAGAAVQRGAVPRPEVAEAEAVLVAAMALLPAAAEEPGAAERLPEAAEVELGAAAGPQPEAAVEAERDGAVRPRVAAEPGAAGLLQAALLSVPPSASVCRRGRLRLGALPLAPRPVARSARGKRSLPSAAPKWRWSQAAQDEV